MLKTFFFVSSRYYLNTGKYADPDTIIHLTVYKNENRCPEGLEFSGYISSDTIFYKAVVLPERTDSVTDYVVISANKDTLIEKKASISDTTKDLRFNSKAR